MSSSLLPVEHCEALTRPPDREVRFGIGACRDRAAIGGKTALPESARVAHENVVEWLRSIGVSSKDPPD